MEQLNRAQYLRDTARWQFDGPRAIPQAFPYQGSKRALASRILSLFPDQVGRLIEPFAGSAAISVAAKLYQRAQTVEISDLNAPLMELWRAIIDDPEHLSSKYEAMWHEQAADPKAYFAKVRARFNQTKSPELLLYLLARCVKAAVRYNSRGDFSQSADNRRLGARPANMSNRIRGASALMQGATVRSDSYEAVLLGANPADLVYMDPPYQGTSHVADHRYLSGIRREEFAAVLAQAVAADLSFIVSYDVVTHDERYGKALPSDLGLLHRHVHGGVSSQGTLHGRVEMTQESLYLSPALVARLGGADSVDARLCGQGIATLF